MWFWKKKMKRAEDFNLGVWIPCKYTNDCTWRIKLGFDSNDALRIVNHLPKCFFCSRYNGSKLDLFVDRNIIDEEAMK